MENSTYIAQTMFGLEDVLAKELTDIGAGDVRTFNRAVHFRGDKASLYRANLLLRTALRILVPMGTWPVRNEEDLYRVIKRLPWEDHLGTEDTLAVGCTLHSDLFRHSQYLALKAKDAIADRFRERTGRRPSVDLDNPTLRIQLHVHGDQCSVSLDSSGGSLHKRGYRDETNLAPLNEVLAAGMILLSGWDGRSNFVDPMCGSGTIPIEAAHFALGIPASWHRPSFGFQHWHDYDADLWENIRAQHAPDPEREGPMILAGELSAHVARKASTNIARAGLKDRITVKNRAFAQLEPPEGGGTLIMNPPYGERMDNEDINALYASIGDTFKKRWQGYNAWLLTSNRTAANHVHLTPKPRIKLFNGSLECRFLRYELYAGTRRKPEATETNATPEA